MKTIKEKKFEEALVKIKILADGTLLVVNAKSVVKFLDIKTLKTKSGFKLNITHLRYKNSVIDFSSDASLFGILNATCSEARLYDAKTKKMIAKIDRHQGEATCVSIDPKGKYMFSGGDDGKSHALDLKTKKIAFNLPIHVDTVNDIVFSDNSQWVATASYDKKIHIFNMTMMSRKHRLKGHNNPVMKVYFLSEHRLFSVDNSNNGIIWDYLKGKVITRLKGIHDDVLHITSSANDEFLFLATQLGYVLVYELESYKILAKKYIKLKSTITALEFDKTRDELIVGTEEGDLLFYSIYEGEIYIRELLQHKKYEEIQRYVEQNPLLAYTKIYHLVMNLWDTTLKKAKQALETGDKQGALNLFRQFKNIPSKNAIMQKVIIEYEEFDKFAYLVENGKLALAYSMITKHPMYKDSKVYRGLEAGWKKAFNLAQKCVIQPKGADTAKEILAPYRGTAQKTKLIQELLNKSEVQKRFRIAVGQKDYKVSFELVKQHPFLKELVEYDNLINFADFMYIKSHKLLEQGETHAALKILRILLDFSDFSVEVKQLMKEIEEKQKFFNALEEEDIASAYNYLSENEELQKTQDGLRLQEDWNVDVACANEYVVDGNILEINMIFKKYMKISSKNIPLANIYGWCYMAQLEKAVKERKNKLIIENGIKNYILYFGLQEQIENFFIIFKREYKSSKLNLSLQTKGSISMWRTSMIVKSILD